MSPLHIENISPDVFNTILARYPDTAPSALADLDTLRYERTPTNLSAKKGEKHLLKSDVEKLVEWKLKHGTFRPALMNLVKSNSGDLIKSTTQAAFTALTKDADIMKSLKLLTALRGIGPATASLLLSVHSPDEVPFFSDELFRWTHWGIPGKEFGWQRAIKYNVTEYKEILASVGGLRKRLGVSAVDAEKVAYVLGKENMELDLGVKSEEDAKVVLAEKVEENREEQKRIKEAAAETAAKVAARLDREVTKEDSSNERASKSGKQGKAATDKEESKKERDDGTGTSEKHISEETEKKGTKRKAQEQKTPAEGTRRSTRKKT